MKTPKTVEKAYVKRKLLNAYNSLPEPYQIELFDTSQIYYPLVYQCQNLFKTALQLISDGSSPGFIYATIIGWLRDEIIILHPAYKINSIDDFWRVIDNLRKEST